MADTSRKLITFQWEGLDHSGRLNRGEISARTEILARAELRRLGIRPGTLQQQSAFERFQGTRKIRPRDIAVFSRQLATLMAAGIPVVQAFEILGRGHEHPAMRHLILGIKTDIERGNPLAESLAKYPKYFDTLFCNLVHAGEQAGILDTLLLKIAEHQEKTESIKNRIKSAMMYPLLVVLIAVIVSTILLVFVVPQFESLFRGFGAALPPMTQAVIDLSRGVETWGPGLLVVAVLAGHVLLRLKRRSERFNRWLDKTLLRLPVLGSVLRKAAIARYARTLAALSMAGVPLVEALPSVAGACGNRDYAEAVRAIRNQVATGHSLQQAMRQAGLFPDMVVQMVAIGEESGTLDGMLAKVADFFEEEVDNAVNALSKLIEPVIMAVLGGLVGGLVLALYLPLFKLGGVV